MANDQVEFSFVANVANAIGGLTGLTSKLDQTATQTTADAKVIQDALSNIGNVQVKNTFLQGFFKDMESMEGAANKAGQGITQALGEKLPGGLSKFAEFLNPVTLGVAALGGAMLEGAFKAAEWGHAIETASNKLGVSTTYLQEMHGAALLAGVSTEAFDNSFAKLNVTAGKAAMGNKQAQEAFSRLGVSVRTAGGEVKSSQTIYDETRDKLSQLESPAVRAAAAQAIFGKGSKETAAILAQTSAQFNQNKQYMLDYGTATQESIEQSAKLGTTGEALGQVFKAGVITAFAPLASMLADMARAIIPVLSDVFKGLGVVMNVVVAVCRALWDIIKSVASVLGSLISYVANVVTSFLKLSGVMGDTGKQAKSLSELFWDALTSMIDQAAEATGEIVGSFRWMSAEIHNIIAGVNNFIANSPLGKFTGMSKMVNVDADQAYADGKKYGTGLYKGVMDSLKKAKDGGGDPASDDGLGNSMAPKGKQKKEKKPKDDIVQKLEEELEKQKTAFEQMNVAQNQHQEFSLQSEADYWQKAMTLSGLSEKDRYDITKKWIAAEEALQKDAFDKKIETDKDQLAADKNNADKRIADLKKIQADTAAFYGAQSKQALAAAKDVAAAYAEETRAALEFFNKQNQELAKAQEQQAYLKGQKTQNQLILDDLRLQNALKLKQIQEDKTLSDDAKQRALAEQKVTNTIDEQNAKLQQQNAAQQQLESALSNLWSNPKQFMEDFFKNFMIKIAAAIVQAIILKETMSQAMGGGGIGGLIASALGISLPGRAVGGSVGGNTPYIVGERGPELFVPSQGGNIITNSALSGMGGGSSVNLSPTYNISLTGDQQQNSQSLAQIKQAQRDQLAQVRYYSTSVPRWSTNN